LKKVGFQKKKGGSPHFKKIQNKNTVHTTSAKRISRVSPSNRTKLKINSHKNQSKVRNFVKNKISKKNRFNDPIKEIQKKKIIACKNE
jgi:hypothetical protein